MKRNSSSRVVSWEQVTRIADNLLPSQEAVEAFWDELVIWTDPRLERVATKSVQKALEAARATLGLREDGQGVLEYIAVIGLVAIVFFVAATWLVNSGILEQIKTALQIP